MLYAGAFLHVFVGVFSLCIMWIKVFAKFFWGDALIAGTAKGLSQRENATNRRYITAYTFTYLLRTWLASWLFWVRFLLLADPFKE